MWPLHPNEFCMPAVPLSVWAGPAPRKAPCRGERAGYDRIAAIAGKIDDKQPIARSRPRGLLAVAVAIDVEINRRIRAIGDVDAGAVEIEHDGAQLSP